MLTEHHITGRDAAFATELVHGTDPPSGHLRRGDRPRRQQGHLASIDPPVLDALAARRPPAARHAGARARRGVDDRRRRATRGRPQAGPLRQRAAALDRQAGPRRAGSRPSPRTRRRRGHVPSGRRTRSGSCEAFREALGPDGDLAALLEADNAPPRVTLVARPGLCEPDELPGEPGPPVAVRAHPRRRRPRRDPGRARGSRRRAGRGLPARRHRPRRRGLGRPRRAVARPVRRPRWQGRPARRPGRAAWTRRWSPTSCSRTGPSSSARPCACCRTSRSPSTTGARVRGRRDRSTACSSTPRAPVWARCAVGPRRAGGAAPTTWRPSCRCNALC